MEVGRWKREKEEQTMKQNNNNNNNEKKPLYVVAKDDTKPLLQDPLWSSDPTQAEQAVLRLPPFPSKYKDNNKL